MCDIIHFFPLLFINGIYKTQPYEMSRYRFNIAINDAYITYYNTMPTLTVCIDPTCVSIGRVTSQRLCMRP